MNLKKFISGISALSIAASAFAAMTITAGAYTPAIIDENFNGEVNSAWTTPSSSRVTAVVTDGVLNMQGEEGKGLDGYLTLPVTSTTKGVYLQFDFDGYSTYADKGMTFRDSSGNPIFNVIYGQGTSGGAARSISVNGEALTEVTTTSTLNLRTMKAYLDFNEHTIDYAIYNQGSETALVSKNDVSFLNSSASNLGQLHFAVRTYSVAKHIYLDNVYVENCSYPAFTLDKEAIETDEETPVTITASDVVGTLSVKSNDDTIATVSEPVDGKFTVTPVAAGRTTVTVTASSEGFTSSSDIEVIVGAPETAAVTVTYKDALGNVLKNQDTIEDLMVGRTYDATDEQKADIDDVVIEGIHYSASLNANSATSVVVAEGAELNLVFDLTEKTYLVTVDVGVPYAKVEINGTSKSGKSNDTIYTDYLGIATGYAYAADSDYTLNITKTGYSVGSGKLTVTQSGGTVTSLTAPTPTDNYLFYEDFENTGVSGALYGTPDNSGGTAGNLFTTVVTADSSKAMLVNGGGRTNRSMDIPLRYTAVTKDVYTLSFDIKAYVANKGNNNTGTTTFKVLDANNVTISTIEYTNSDYGIDAMTVNSTDVVTVDPVGAVTITVDTKTKTATTTASGTTSAIENINAGAPVKINLSTKRSHIITFDNITLTGTDVVDPSANLEDAAWGVTDESTGYTASGSNVLTDANEKSVYGYKATLTGNGYSYDTVKVFVTTTDGKTAEETYSDTTVSGSGTFTFYVISDTVLNKDASRVYCE